MPALLALAEMEPGLLPTMCGRETEGPLPATQPVPASLLPLSWQLP